MESQSDYLSFYFYIGGYFSQHTELQTFKNRLYYCRDLMGHRREELVTEYAEPIEIDMKALHKILAPCLNWRSDYNDMNTFDGTQWTLSLQMNGQSQECYGSNAYPENFRQVIKELEQLIQRPLR